MIRSYVRTLARAIETAEVTNRTGGSVLLDDAMAEIGRSLRAAHDRDNKLIFVGNGGSAGIASHMATDYSKNGGVRALALNDSAVLTCLGNDFGYEQVFRKQIEWHARAGDILIAISSSGRSPNILNAVAGARARDCVVYTLSGFRPDNPLRRTGDLNIFVDDREYGFVEVGHLAILHGLLDMQLCALPTGPRRVAERA